MNWRKRDQTIERVRGKIRNPLCFVLPLLFSAPNFSERHERNHFARSLIPITQSKCYWCRWCVLIENSIILFVFFLPLLIQDHSWRYTSCLWSPLIVSCSFPAVVFSVYMVLQWQIYLLSLFSTRYPLMIPCWGSIYPFHPFCMLCEKSSLTSGFAKRCSRSMQCRERFWLGLVRCNVEEMRELTRGPSPLDLVFSFLIDSHHQWNDDDEVACCFLSLLFSSSCVLSLRTTITVQYTKKDQEIVSEEGHENSKWQKGRTKHLTTLV